MKRVGFGGAVVLGVAAVFAGACGGTSSGDPTGASGSSGSTGTGGAGGTGSSDAGTSFTLEVDATKNFLILGGCGLTTATIADVPAGTYTATLSASTLTKGGVSGPTPAPASTDNYVIVNVPLPAGDPHEDHRFFMLNGIGAQASITLPSTMTISVMFVDSDTADNSGTGTVTVSPGGYTATVDAVANDLAWDTGCHSTPAMLVVPDGPFNTTLTASTLSSGGGAHDDFVLVRTPSETAKDDFRYFILNGVGASHVFTRYNSTTLRAWYIGASAGTGTATLSIDAQ